MRITFSEKTRASAVMHRQNSQSAIICVLEYCCMAMPMELIDAICALSRRWTSCMPLRV